MRKRFLVFGCVALGASSVACGNTADESSVTTGSYELDATHVVRLGESPSGGVPTLDYFVRVDVPEAGSGEKVVVTPVGGLAASYNRASDGTLTPVEGDGAWINYLSDHDSWSSIELHENGFHWKFADGLVRRLLLVRVHRGER